MPLVTHRLESQLLAGNPLGDPTARDVVVWSPEGVGDRPLPALLALPAFLGTAQGFFLPDPLGEPLDRRLERLIRAGAMPPVRVVVPDVWTRLGGTQYIDSPAVGAYARYVVDEVVPFATARAFATRWGVFGRSSGGYGALRFALERPGVFAAVAAHSADAGFEYCYLPDVAASIPEITRAGGAAAWLDTFWAAENRKKKAFMSTLNVVAMAAHYSPDAAAPLGIGLPYEPGTGRFRADVWERWRAHDLCNLLHTGCAALRQLRALWVDCGTRDEFQMIWGARTIHAALERAGIPHVYEEFDDGHFNGSYRFDRSLPALARALG